MFGFGMFVLLLALRRARNLPPGKSFAEMHIPERDPIVLRRVSITILIATFFGLAQEIIGGIQNSGRPFSQLAHEVVYFGFFMVGVCGLLESTGRLPPDSHRAALVLAFWGSGLIWHTHGVMKQLPVDQSLHILLAYVNYADAAVVAYSMRFTDSINAFVGGWALMILQATWLLTCGVYECCWDYSMHQVTAFLSGQCMLILLFIVLVFAAFGPKPSKQDDPEFRQGFSPLDGSNHMESFL